MKKKSLFVLCILTFIILNISIDIQSNKSDFSVSSILKLAFADTESNYTPCGDYISSFESTLRDCLSGSYQTGTVKGSFSCTSGNIGLCHSGSFSYKYGCDGTCFELASPSIINCV